MGIIIRQSIKGTAVNYIGAFIGFLTTIFVVTLSLGKENYGLIQTITQAGLLLTAVGQFGTSYSAFKFFPYFKNPEKKHNGFFFYLLVVPFIGFIVVSIVVFLVQDPIKEFYSTNAKEFVHYFYWIFPLAFFAIYQSVFETYSNILMRIVVPKFVREILIRVLAVISFLAYGFGYINLDCLVAINVFIYFIAALINLLYICKIGNISLRPNYSFIRKPLRKSILSFTLYMILASIGYNLVLKIDTFMVAGMMGLAAAGIYNIAYYMGVIVEMPMRSIGSIATPIAAEYFKKKEIGRIDELYKKVSLNQFIIGGLIFMLICININNIFDIIPKGKELGEATSATSGSGKWVVFFIALGYLVNSICSFGSTLLSISKYYYYTLFFTFFLSALTITGNYYLIPLFGISGVGMATMCGFIIYNACMWFLIKKKVGVQPFSFQFLKIIALLLVLFALNYLGITLSNPYLDCALRSILFGGIYLAVVYFCKISPDVNNSVISILKWVRTTLFNAKNHDSNI